MRPKDYGFYLEDILGAIEKIERYIEGVTFEHFSQDGKTVDAVLRNLEIIGEATKMIPEKMRSRFPSIPWKDMAGMRDRLIHKYFAVALDVVWKTLITRLPNVKLLIEEALDEIEKSPN
ncbi:MAG: DUF86 domain-containing protein [Candidatus Atabeyarchaeum deiterrae]